ncbi:MAG: CHAT domain-containing protein [Candidatus Hodarchaeota archaeon]
MKRRHARAILRLDSTKNLLGANIQRKKGAKLDPTFITRARTQLRDLYRIREIQTRTLMRQEEERAKYGGIGVPPRLEHSIEDIKLEINRIDIQIRELENSLGNYGARQAANSKVLRKSKVETKEAGPTPESRRITILFIAANPRGTNPLRLDEEIRSIDEALLQAKFRDKFDLEQQWAVRVKDLSGHLLRYEPDIVHFSGHGSMTSEIILEDVSGESHPVSGRALSELFRVLKANIRCVVLNACYSEPQAKAIAQHIDCVIGMSKAIGDSAAINFARSFYRALAFGKDVKTAFDLGCVEIDMANLNEKDTPKLLCEKCDPREIVFIESIPARKESPPQKLKQLPKLSEKCSDIIALLNSFNEDPSSKNDRKAWEGFREFIAIMEQTSSEYGLHDEYTELIKIRNALGRLRRQRNVHRSAGRDDLADNVEDTIQSNYGDSIRIIKEIQKKASAYWRLT